MKYLIMDTYEQFQCVGGECTDTCCAGFRVIVDAKTAKMYREQPGEFGEELRDSLKEDNGIIFFEMKEGNCPFLTKDRLCRIYQELGPENMCFTCKSYPRIIRGFGDITFFVLTLACPEAVRLLMEHEGAVQFDFAEDDKPCANEKNIDWKLFNGMITGLTSSINILQNRSLPFPVRLRLLVLFQTELQNCIQQEQDIDALKFLFSSPENYLQLAQTLEGTVRNDTEKIRSFIQFINNVRETNFLEFFYQPIVHFVEQFMNEQDLKAVEDLYAQVSTPEYENWYENYCVYYLVWHYMDALETKKPLEKTQELIWMLNLQQYALMAELAYSGSLSRERHIRIVSCFSRMFEHNTQNLKKVRKELLDSRASDAAYWLSMI